MFFLCQSGYWTTKVILFKGVALFDLWNAAVQEGPAVWASIISGNVTLVHMHTAGFHMVGSYRGNFL